MHVLLAHFSHDIKKQTLYVFLMFVALFLSHTAFAAEVTITPSTGTYSNGQSFTATIQVNPQSKSVNAVEAKLSFDSTKLSVVSVSKTGSVFSLWTTEPTFSNTAGTIDFGGGSPTPFTAKSTLLIVTFKAKEEGSATVSVTTGSVLAADGLGTNVYTGAGNATYTVSASAPVPEPVETPTPTKEPTKKPVSEDATITFGDPPRVPEAGSTVFLDPEIWYATKIGQFTWSIPFDVDSMALDMSTSSTFEPVTVFDPLIEEFSTSADILKDGIQYLTLRYKNQVGWGGILHRKIMVDTLPPQKFTINVRAGNSATAFPLLTFEAIDETSGIEHYELTLAQNEPIKITPDEARLGYLINNLEDGTYTVKVVAYDFAGNKTESTVPILITAGWHPPVEVVIKGSAWDIFKGKNLVIIILVLISILLIAYILYIRKQQELKDQKLRKETREIQDQMEKIFSALRDEMYDQINLITKRERLSKKEKEAVEGINQALEVSETLIEKEIVDVSKILK